MTAHPYEYLALAKVAEVERNANEPGRLMAHELRRARPRGRRRWRTR